MRVYIGIDWSNSSHDIVYLNEEGGVILYQNIPHSPVGFETLDRQRLQLGVGLEECLVGIETEHNLLLDFLSARGYGQIYIIPPLVVRDCRGRFGVSGAKTDRSDARLIADLLRTDRARLHVWQPDSQLTQRIASLVSLDQFLTRTIPRTAGDDHPEPQSPAASALALLSERRVGIQQSGSADQFGVHLCVSDAPGSCEPEI